MTNVARKWLLDDDKCKPHGNLSQAVPEGAQLSCVPRSFALVPLDRPFPS
jgi:hypothetical protein